MLSNKFQNQNYIDNLVKNLTINIDNNNSNHDQAINLSNELKSFGDNSLNYNVQVLIKVLDKKYYPDNIDIEKYSYLKTTTGHYFHNGREIGYNINFVVYNHDNRDIGMTWNLLYDIDRDFGMIDNAKFIFLNSINLNEKSHYNTKLSTNSYLPDFMNSMQRYYSNRNFNLKD